MDHLLRHDGKGSELISDKHAEPHKDDTRLQQEPNQISIKVLLVTFLGGGGLAGIFGCIARIVDNPWSTFANAAAIICLLITMAAAVHEVYPRTKGLVIGIGMLAGFGVLILAANKTETFLQTQGIATKVLSPAPASEPSVALEKPTFHERIENVQLVVGSVSLLGPNDPSIFVQGTPPWRIYLKNGILYADVLMWSGTANTPAVEVRGNEFVVRPPGWDRNSNANALEVINEAANPVFQMIRLTPSSIRINGIFPLRTGAWAGSLFIADEKRFTVVDQLPSDFKLTPIFKYPSWKYPGKYADRSN